MSNLLKDRFPELYSQIDVQKNIDEGISYENITQCSTKKLWWICCKCNINYDMQVQYRTKQKSGCPYCAGKRVLPSRSFGALFPNLLLDWDYSKNRLDPFCLTTHSSSKTVYWICHECKFEWRTDIDSRTKLDGTGCPKCSKQKTSKKYSTCQQTEKSLGILYPDLLQEWDYELNSDDPYKIYPKSHKIINWKCKNGHKWLAPVSRRTNGSKCFDCRFKKKQKIVHETEKIVRERKKKENCDISYQYVDSVGNYCDSIQECIFSNYFFLSQQDNLIKNYFVHKRVCFERQWMCDFYIEFENYEPLWLEFDGLGENRKLWFGDKDHKEKIEYYNNNNYNFYVFYNINEFFEFFKDQYKIDLSVYKNRNEIRNIFNFSIDKFKEDIKQDVEHLSKTVERKNFTYNYYENNGKFSQSSITKYFGSWTNVLKEIGINQINKKGSNHQNSIFSNEQVISYRKEFLELNKISKFSSLEFSKMKNVSHSAMNNMLNGTTYYEIPDYINEYHEMKKNRKSKSYL